MQPLYVVILQSDERIAESVASALCDSFHSVEFAKSLTELRRTVARHKAGIAIVDMEMAPLSEVRKLSREFPQTAIVCTHRLPDEAMWTDALTAGAADICASSDVPAIVRSAQGSAASALAAAAA